MGTMEQTEQLMFQGFREKGELSNGWTIQDVLVGTVLRGFHTLVSIHLELKTDSSRT